MKYNKRKFELKTKQMFIYLSDNFCHSWSLFASLNHLFIFFLQCLFYEPLTHSHTRDERDIGIRMKVNTTINYEGNEKHTKQISVNVMQPKKRDI